MQSQLVIATGNPGKLTEMRALLVDAEVEILGLDDLPGDLPGDIIEPIEDGETFEDNARIKALSYAKQTGMPCLADDSGLIVDALGGAPGVISSHYATQGVETGIGREERDAANNAALLGALTNVPLEARLARFVCVCVLANHKGTVLHTTRGTFEGCIGTQPRVPAGTGGFGYDPLFLVAPDYAFTSAQLGSSEKNRLSHRGEAVRKMAKWITSNWDPHDGNG